MTDYTDVFGSDTVVPSKKAYSNNVLTEDSSFQWPFNYSGTGALLSTITDISCSAGLTLTLPSANIVGKGEDVLIRNVGSNDVIIVDSADNEIVNVVTGSSKYLFVTDNSTSAGVWAVVDFGAGTSVVDAASLIGYGVKSISSTLNQSHPVTSSATGITIDSSHRAKVIVHTGGLSTYGLTSTSTLGNDFFFLFRNEGTGTVTIDPNLAEKIDSANELSVQPGESVLLFCSGAAWFTVGQGRAVQYNFTQLTKDISAGGTIVLSSTEAGNKLLTFTGNPGSSVIVEVPPVVSVYYVYNKLSTAQTVTIKTHSGTGTGVSQNGRVIIYCDGTNIVAAQTIAATSSVEYPSGTVTNPSAYFSSKTNTGFHLSGAQDFGIAVNGAEAGVFTSTGLKTAASGNLTSVSLNAALSELQTDIDNRQISSSVLTELASVSLTAAGKAILDDADNTAQRATLVAAKSGVNTDITSLSGITSITETVYSINDASFAIDPTNGPIQTVTLTAGRTPTATFSAGQSVTLMINNGSGDYTITWSTVAPVWVGGAQPTLANSGYTVVVLWKVGSTIYGKHVGDVA